MAQVKESDMYSKYGRTTDHSLMETQTEIKGHANYDAFADLEEGQEALVEEANSEGDEEFKVEEEDTEDEAAQDEEDDEDEDEENEQDHEETAKEEPKVNEPAPEDVKVLPSFPFENDSIKGRETRGQISCYAGVTMMVQHRSHLFMILICGRFARFIRWDRSGAIVSKRFDYTKEKTLLFNFYSRFAQLSPSQRGKDPTVSPLMDPDEDAIARAKFKHFDTDIFISIEEQKLLRIEMTVNNKICRFVICAPKFDDSALDLKDAGNEGLLFMKDYWREDSPRTVKESDVYHLLAQYDVPHVAKMEIGGDIPDMVTITPQLDGYHLATLQAHRIFLKTIGRDLTTFCSVKSLATCIADAMKAHQVAFHRACILHRDISVGNIMITSNHRGFLIDWDHCVILTDRGADKRGTWHFMSARLLASFGNTHTIWRYDILPIHFNQLHYIMV
ncbi:hypothetical protein EDD18DRAFT_1163158 [Armillaria luteobubalina]|uniref:Fungal-type protein kinase domain-containing protein n=1 Tax=Armillaria luteobubalina TaxID=153913 RepID=A0AA39UTF2_9AGAR|nr:hypothetical protein EDD18DRAFT_1163158 [Armillaria luteobubalina]